MKTYRITYQNEHGEESQIDIQSSIGSSFARAEFEESFTEARFLSIRERFDLEYNEIKFEVFKLNAPVNSNGMPLYKISFEEYDSIIDRFVNREAAIRIAQKFIEKNFC